LDDQTQEIVNEAASEKRQTAAAVDQRAQIKVRRRAEELRTTADQFEVPSARDTLRNAAANYDKMADNAEALLSGHLPSPGEKAG
jgi:hypothetical protein